MTGYISWGNPRVILSLTAKVATAAFRKLRSVWWPNLNIGLSGDNRRLYSAIKNDFHVQLISDQRHVPAKKTCLFI